MGRTFFPHATIALIMLLAMLGLASCTDSHDHTYEMGVLKERAQARWDAILAEDFETVRTFYPPEKRDDNTVASLRGRYALQADRKSVQVGDVFFGFDDPTLATVVVHQEFDLHGTAGAPPVGAWNELWEKHEGQWWFVRIR